MNHERYGPLCRRLAVLIGALMFAFLSTVPIAAERLEEAPGIGLEERLQQLADQAGAPLHFEETRSSGLLAEPITVRGRLIYDPVTEQLTKQVDSPRPARLSVTETHLVAQVGDGRLRRLPLAQRPDLAALLVAVRALLAGQVDTIEAQFQPSLETDEAGDQWSLSLRPRDPRLAEDLERLEILGSGDQIHTLQATLKSGIQRMRILPPDPEPLPEPEAGPEPGPEPAQESAPSTADDAH